MRVASSVAAAARSISMTGYIFATILASTLWAAAGVAMGYGLTELLEIRHIIIALTAFCAGSALLAAIKHVRQKNHAQAVV